MVMKPITVLLARTGTLRRSPDPAAPTSASNPRRRVVPAEQVAAGRRPGGVAVSSGRGAVAEVDHAVAETAFVEEFKLQADIVGERLLAASHHDGCDEQVAFIDQPGLERVAGEVGTAHRELTFPGRLQLSDGFR